MMENLPRGRRSRRSSSNINLTNISPLTTHFSLTAREDPDATSPQYSYIQGASAPSTPSILSRAPSSKRRPHKPTLSVPATPRVDLAALSKSKSVSHLLDHRRQTSYFDTRTVRRSESTEWVHRAGLALTSEARESKGQSWLASRASSTSLLSTDSDTEDEDGETTGRRAAAASRRSASQLRNLSHPHLRLDISSGGMHPLAPEFIDEAFIGSSFDADNEPAYTFDNVDVLDDDEELHWSKRPRTGLGSWVDRMVGWSLFSVDEGIDSDEEYDDEREVVASHKPLEPPRLTLPEDGGAKDEDKQEESKSDDPPLQDASVWSDAGWVLSLAAKVIFE
ncbi:hypothetical protein Dda_1807 [Drechslerella dactyloides]|uniref:Uncharacterized protein n=1 Tax=Drechslerella dactyloides TaxID=74499 RepID=A0AAD6NKY7_DREDA|nr:hypothetical protein Dda_1807 [Drechslerella dactyloides]